MTNENASEWRKRLNRAHAKLESVPTTATVAGVIVALAVGGVSFWTGLNADRNSREANSISREATDLSRQANSRAVTAEQRIQKAAEAAQAAAVFGLIDFDGDTVRSITIANTSPQPITAVRVEFAGPISELPSYLDPCQSIRFDISGGVPTGDTERPALLRLWFTDSQGRHWSRHSNSEPQRIADAAWASVTKSSDWLLPIPARDVKAGQVRTCG